MGAGTDPAGANIAGLDLQTPSRERIATVPAALAFDGATRNFKLDDRGRYVEAHPVDAKVFLILRTELSSIRSAAGTGQGVRSIRYIDKKTIKASVTNRVNTALSKVVAAREIRIDSVDVDTSVRAGIVFAVNYVNLVTGRPGTFR